MQANEPPEREIDAEAAKLLGLLEDSGKSTYSLTIVTGKKASTINVSVSTGHSPNELSEHHLMDDEFTENETADEEIDAAIVISSFMTKDERL